MQPSDKLERLQTLVGQSAEKSAEIVSVLAALLSVPPDERYPSFVLTAAQQKRATFNALLGVLERQSEQIPGILVFEDVHWIDPSSMELLELVRDHVRSWRTLAILLSRPELNLGSWRQPHITVIALNRLDRSQIVPIILSLAGGLALPEPIVDEIVVKSDGVPLFVEEMTKAVLEYKVTREAELLADFRSSLTVPDTLHESLMARLDQVASMKTVAQIAAVIGREFSLGLLQRVAGLSQTDVHVAIDRLIAAGLLFRSDIAAEESFAFKHALVQDEAYASLLRDERRRLHRCIADALCADATDHVAPEVIAQHYTQAGDVRLALDYWMKAGRQAGERFAFLEASTHLRNAIEKVSELPASPQRDELELQLHYSLGNALIVAKGFGASETGQTFRRALDLCDRFRRRCADHNGTQRHHRLSRQPR